MEQLIVEYPGVVPPDLCRSLIERFDYYSKHGDRHVRVQDKLESDGGTRKPGVRSPKEASVIYLSSTNVDSEDCEFAQYIRRIHECLGKTLDEYWIQMGELLGKSMLPLALKQLDFIRYERAFGYYDAHVDAFSQTTQWRVISIVTYLNEVRTGGETEFTLFGRSVAPQVGKVLIFPSFYGCIHRSRLAESDPKYIIAGFVGYR